MDESSAIAGEVTVEATDIGNGEHDAGRQPPRGDYKLEAMIIPVADVDRAKAFYSGLGWRLDAEGRFDNGFRGVQFTPPGSGCSIQFGSRKTSAAPGSGRGYLIVADIELARTDLLARGVEVSPVFHPTAPGAQFGPGDRSARADGPASNRQSYCSFATFSDPDGNLWLLQEVTTRLPGHVEPTQTTFASVADLAGALRRAAAAHHEYEQLTGTADPDWADWYAAHLVAEQTGEA
jgi:catechol 2,3-dioxygenase-like lactoylglutathione lyase family enzyme